MLTININHVVLTGRLTSDPELYSLPSGSSVCELRIAVNARRRDLVGEWVEKPNFFDVVVYGAPGENVAKYVHKGRPVAISGRLDWREWETRDGHRAQAVRIIARNVQFLNPPNGNAPTSVNGSDGAGTLDGIAGEDDELLAPEDHEAIALAAAER